MFKNRTLQVDVVKKNEKVAEPDLISDMKLENKRIWITQTIESSIKKIGIAVCAYVVLDTARKVAVELAKQQ